VHDGQANPAGSTGNQSNFESAGHDWQGLGEPEPSVEEGKVGVRLSVAVIIYLPN
jgi:hypothetical protein